MPAPKTPILRLEAFLPYRLSVASNRMSARIADAYRSRFGLSIPEWRVMALLGREGGLTAGDLVERSAMDKVAVSRAVARLAERALVSGEGDSADRRRRNLALTAAGMRIFEEIEPLALALEAEATAGLTAAERTALDRILKKLGV
jgi:DNA-binding MarR family transcriptional regulator